MNNNKKQSEHSYRDSEKNPNIQFTELTSDDISTHEDIYIDMLVGLAPKCSLPSVPSGTYEGMYYGYAIAEALKSKQMFHKTFK